MRLQLVRQGFACMNTYPSKLRCATITSRRLITWYDAIANESYATKYSPPPWSVSNIKETVVHVTTCSAQQLEALTEVF
jgi:hypothetical protein